MAGRVRLRTATARANDLEFGLLEAGSGPLELARGTDRLLAPSSRMVVIEHAGHFLQLERPGEVIDHIIGWVTG